MSVEPRVSVPSFAGRAVGFPECITYVFLGCRHFSCVPSGSVCLQNATLSCCPLTRASGTQQRRGREGSHAGAVGFIAVGSPCAKGLVSHSCPRQFPRCAAPYSLCSIHPQYSWSHTCPQPLVQRNWHRIGLLEARRWEVHGAKLLWDDLFFTQNVAIRVLHMFYERDLAELWLARPLSPTQALVIGFSACQVPKMGRWFSWNAGAKRGVA